MVQADTGWGLLSVRCPSERITIDDGGVFGTRLEASGPATLEWNIYGERIEAVAQIEVIERVGEVLNDDRNTTPDYLRRYTLDGVLDCEDDPDLNCQGVWHLHLEGVQTANDVRFSRGDPP